MRAGFSLIEVLVVLVLLGIMAAVSVPAFRGLQEEDPAVETARELRELLTRVRATAIERGESATLALDPEGSRFRVTVGSEGAPEDLAEGRLQREAPLYPTPGARYLRLRFTPSGAVFGDSIVVAGGPRALVVGADRWTGEPYVRWSGEADVRAR